MATTIPNTQFFPVEPVQGTDTADVTTRQPMRDLLLGPSQIDAVEGANIHTFVWSGFNITPTTGQTDPFGGTGATLWTDNGSGSNHYSGGVGDGPLVAFQAYRVRLYFKQGTYTGGFALRMWGPTTDTHIDGILAPGAGVQGYTGLTLGQGVKVSGIAVQPVGAGWWLVQFDYVAPEAGYVSFEFWFNAVNVPYTGSGQTGYTYGPYLGTLTAPASAYDYDLQVTNGDLALVSGTPSIVQHARMRMLLFQGEMYNDLLAGIGYFQQVFMKGTDLDTLRGIYQQALSGTDGVASINNLALVWDNYGRTLNVTWSAVTSNAQLASDIKVTVPVLPSVPT